MASGDQKYLLLTTFTRDGMAVATSVWAADLDDVRVGFRTSSRSGKAKRLGHTGRVTVQPCDARAKVQSESASSGATAELVTDARCDEIRQEVVAKYGFQVKITKLLGTIGGTLVGRRNPCGAIGVVITPA